MGSRPPSASVFRSLLRGLLEPVPQGHGALTRSNFVLATTQKSFQALLQHARPGWTPTFPSPSKVKAWASNFQHGLKIMGAFVGKECSPIFAQRVFRTFRVLQLHSKLWSSNHLQGMRPLGRKALLSFLLVSLCDANPGIGDSILQSELVEHMKDLDFIHELTRATVVCPHCKDRLVVDKKVPTVKYCHCPNTETAYDKKVKGYAWTPFVETPDLLIWRMPHPDRPGLFMYKVYGYYDDISPEEFLNTQLDIDYRKQWDDTVIKLDVIESNQETSQDVIYWEMKWPTMFSNRDYLFARRHLVDREKGTIVIINKAVSRPSVPDMKGIHRVKEYWSVMQINAVKGLSQNGVEFGLTYFDNPGVSLPQWMNNWAAMTAIPDFLDKQRNATRKRKKKGSSKSSSKSSSYSKSSDATQRSSETGKSQCQAGSQTTINSTSTPKTTSTSCNNQETSQQPITTAPSSRDGDLKILSQYFKENILQSAQ